MYHHSSKASVLRCSAFFVVQLSHPYMTTGKTIALNPVSPKGNQSSLFIGKTDVEAETPILWSPDAKNWLLGKEPDVGKDRRQEEKGTTEDEMVGGHHWLEGRKRRGQQRVRWLEGITDSMSLRFMTFYRRQGSRPSPWKRNAKKQNGTSWGLLKDVCLLLRSFNPLGHCTVGNVGAVWEDAFGRCV